MDIGDTSRDIQNVIIKYGHQNIRVQTNKRMNVSYFFAVHFPIVPLSFLLPFIFTFYNADRISYI